MKTPKRSKRPSAVKSVQKRKASKRARTYDDLDIGHEQVTSNECWNPEDVRKPPERVYGDLQLGEEQVTSNECYDVKEE